MGVGGRAERGRGATNGRMHRVRGALVRLENEGGRGAGTKNRSRRRERVKKQINVGLPLTRSPPQNTALMTTLAKVLGDAVRPTLKDGIWRKPALSGRAASAARKLLGGEGDE